MSPTLLIFKRHRGRPVRRSGQRNLGIAVMVIKINLPIIRLSVIHPGRDDLLEFHHARMVQILDHIIHLFEERDPFLEAVFLKFLWHVVWCSNLNS